MNWYNISERIRTDRAVFDLCHEYESFVNKPKTTNDDNSENLLPLHELIAKK
jgi:hypothetical protein